MHVWSWVFAVAGLTGLLSGCSRTPTPAPVAGSAPDKITQTLFGYTFQFEHASGESSKVAGRRNVDRKGDGTEVLDEDLIITCGPQTAKITNGKLSLGGADRGTVKLGDTIRLTSSGALSVNGEVRVAPPQELPLSDVCWRAPRGAHRCWGRCRSCFAVAVRSPAHTSGTHSFSHGRASYPSTPARGLIPPPPSLAPRASSACSPTHGRGGVIACPTAHAPGPRTLPRSASRRPRRNAPDGKRCEPAYALSP